MELSRLKSERLLTNARLQKLNALEAENTRLRAMLDARRRVRDQVRVAEIMSVDANPFDHSLVIDIGTQDGVFDGQALVGADGVVGQVIKAGLMTSQAMLISDTDHALPVEVNRNGLRTIVVGTGSIDSLELPFIVNNADIRVGDLLVTSGLGGAFPPGYPVAISRNSHSYSARTVCRCHRETCRATGSGTRSHVDLFIRCSGTGGHCG